MDDGELLREFVDRQSDKAFAELAERHLDLVYSTALRMVQDAALAKDISQAVFIQLARKARTVRSGNSLPGWLYHVTRCQAANSLRSERTRRLREAEAMNMTLSDDDSSASWEAIAPHLEDAMTVLSDEDQNAVVMRFFQGRSWRDVGAAMALSDDAAQKRVSRALEKLRGQLLRRGVTVSAGAIGIAIAANAVQAAPASLLSTVTAVSFAGSGATAATIGSTTLKALFMKKTTIAIIALVTLIAGVTTPVVLAKVRKARLNAPPTEMSLREGLVLHMTFDQDESGFGRITDSSEMKNHGYAKDVTWVAEGKKGGAYKFTADGNEIVITNNASLNPEQLTLSAWIKTTTGDHYWRRVFDKAYSQGFALSIAGDWQGKNWYGKVSMEIGPGTHDAITKARVDDGQWHQVVTTFDGSDQLVYVDGQLQGNVHWNEPGKVGATDFNLVIGCNRSNLDKKEDDLGVSFRGIIDEPMMWNRALSEKEVAFLFASQNGSPTAN